MSSENEHKKMKAAKFGNFFLLPILKTQRRWALASFVIHNEFGLFFRFYWARGRRRVRERQKKTTWAYVKSCQGQSAIHNKPGTSFFRTYFSCVPFNKRKVQYVNQFFFFVNSLRLLTPKTHKSNEKSVKVHAHAFISFSWKLNTFLHSLFFCEFCWNSAPRRTFPSVFS